MTKADVEDVDPDGTAGDDLVRFYVRVTNGTANDLKDLYGGMTVSYGDGGDQARQAFTTEQGFEEYGTIRSGRSKTISATFAVPAKSQRNVTMDFELDNDHAVASFIGSVK